MEFSRVWLPYIYLYGAGAVIFVGGLVMVLKSEAFDRLRRGDRRWIGLLVFGFGLYAVLHLAWILAAVYLSEPAS